MTTAISRQSGPRAVLTPAVDIYENDEEFRLLADLPGVSAQDLSLDLEQGRLLLVAERRAPTVAANDTAPPPDDAEQETTAEAPPPVSLATYRRVFRIPREVEPSAIEASLDNGVLQVRLPKSEHSRPRKIAIKAMA